MMWLMDYTMAHMSDLKTMAKPWYCLHEDLSQKHNTTTVKAMYHFFCFALLHPQKGICSVGQAATRGSHTSFAVDGTRMPWVWELGRDILWFHIARVYSEVHTR